MESGPSRSAPSESRDADTLDESVYPSGRPSQDLLARPEPDYQFDQRVTW